MASDWLVAIAASQSDAMFENLLTNKGLTWEFLRNPGSWPPFCWRHFQMHFLEWKWMNLDYIVNEICS